MSQIPADLIKMPYLSASVRRLEAMAETPFQVFQEIHDALINYLQEPS